MTDPKQIARHVQQSYDSLPFPPLEMFDFSRKSMPEWEWMTGMCHAGQESHSPRRILVAGCGTGEEGYRLAKMYPDAEVIALDFSAKSIALARKARPSYNWGNVRFEVADLADPKLTTAFPGPFDLITCHGVLISVPDVDAVLTNLHAMLDEDGIIYAGVEGAAHFSNKLRPALRLMGFDPQRFEEHELLDPSLRLYDKLNDVKFLGELPPALRAAYLQHDIFGAVMNAWSLEKWCEAFESAGFHLHGSSATLPLFLALVGSDLRPLFHLPRRHVCAVLDHFRPADFHRLVFAKNPPSDPPWNDAEALSQWRPQLWMVPPEAIPPQEPPFDVFLKLKLPYLAGGDYQITTTRYMCELMRSADGVKSFATLQSEIDTPVPFSDLTAALFIMSQLMLFHVLPPRKTVAL